MGFYTNICNNISDNNFEQDSKIYKNTRQKSQNNVGILDNWT